MRSSIAFWLTPLMHFVLLPPLPEGRQQLLHDLRPPAPLQLAAPATPEGLGHDGHRRGTAEGGSKAALGAPASRSVLLVADAMPEAAAASPRADPSLLGRHTP